MRKVCVSYRPWTPYSSRLRLIWKLRRGARYLPLYMRLLSYYGGDFHDSCYIMFRSIVCISYIYVYYFGVQSVLYKGLGVLISVFGGCRHFIGIRIIRCYLRFLYFSFIRVRFVGGSRFILFCSKDGYELGDYSLLFLVRFRKVISQG